MAHVPERGDVIWLNFNPQQGHEQAGRRPAVVLSLKLYNRKAGLALICPITNQVKNYPFEVKIPSELEISGAVLADQVKSLDWKARNAEFIIKMPAIVMNEIFAKVQTLLQ